MPIRTHRGRAAVYRRLWGWPLRSPGHLAVTLIFLVALVVAVGVLVPTLLGDEQQDSATPALQGPDRQQPSRAAPPAGASTAPTRLTRPLASPTTAKPNPDALRIAKRWATAWVNHPAGISNAQWLDALRPYTTEEYLPQMSTVDPVNIPAKAVTGEPRATKSYTSSVEVLVPTDALTLSMTVVSTNAGWRIAHYDQAG